MNLPCLQSRKLTFFRALRMYVQLACFLYKNNVNMTVSELIRTSSIFVGYLGRQSKLAICISRFAQLCNQLYLLSLITTLVFLDVYSILITSSSTLNTSLSEPLVANQLPGRHMSAALKEIRHSIPGLTFQG